MFLGFFDDRPMLDHVALGADNDCRSNCPLHFFAVHHLFAESRVFLHYVDSGVGQEHVRQIVLLGEFIVGWNTILAHAQYHRVKLLELVVALAEPASFLGSTRGAVFRVEKQHDGLPLVILQRMFFAVATFQTKRRRFLAF